MLNDKLNLISRRHALALLGITAATGLVARPAFAAQSASLGWTPGAATPQIALAIQNGLWDAESLSLEPISFPSGREALEALLSNGVNFASLSEFPVVTAALSDQDVVVLAGLSTYLGHRIIINKASGASSIAALAGKKVGVTLGTNMQYLADAVLKGVTVEYVNVAPGDLAPALARGDVDAAFMFDTFYPQARSVLGENYLEIMTSEQYPQQFLVVSTKAFVESNPAVVSAFLAALLKADIQTADNTPAAADAVSATTGGSVSADFFMTQFSNFNFEIAINALLLPLMVSQGEFINSIGLIEKPATADLFRPHIAEASLVALAPERVTL